MSEPLELYMNQLNKLVYIRWLHCGQESPEEDALLELMDTAWLDLPEPDKAYLGQLPSRSFIRTSADRIQVDMDLEPGPRRVMIDRMEAA